MFVWVEVLSKNACICTCTVTVPSSNATFSFGSGVLVDLVVEL